jgi:hypothetical protein
MTSRTALFALLAIWGVGLSGATLPARADDTVESATAELSKDQVARPDGFTNRVWQRTDQGDMPGVIRIFLSDGTLVQDSCWETHRLSAWKMGADQRLSWTEDGVEIGARIAGLTADHLTLELDLKGGPVVEHYTAAPVPSVCPDMPKA